jgi:hypothetical protein
MKMLVPCCDRAVQHEDAYQRLRDFVRCIGGDMASTPHGDGVLWTLRLHGRIATVPVPNHAVNALDAFYMPAGDLQPQTFHDLDQALVRDAFWKLVSADFWGRADPGALGTSSGAVA